MKELIIILIASSIVNNVVLSQFLGLCPFLGVSRKTETAAGMGGAVIFVITISSLVASLIYKFILVPTGFEYLQTIPELSDYELLVENITWWAWKNIYKAQKNEKKIVVWWYNFLMMCYAQKVKFDELIIRNIRWAQSDLILTDMQWYSPE